MPPFRRVEDRSAGPNALGILVPPGRRCMVIVRPRALPWDLLSGSIEAESGALRLRDFERDEAAAVARRLHRQLELHALAIRDLLEIGVDAAGRGFLVWVRDDALLWIACARRPGLPYQQQRFVSADEAEAAARRIAPFVCPAPDAGQEVYFNTQHFATSEI